MAEYTYDDNSIREDLLDFIEQLDPTEHQLYTGLGKSTAKSTLHEWLTDSYKGAESNAQVEGFTPSFGARTRPQRVTNRTQIVSTDFEVTDTERAVNNAGFNDRYAYEMEKAMVEWKDDAEFNLMRGSLATGTGSAARQMTGLKAAITTNATTQSGVSLDEDMLNDYFQLVFENSKERIDEIYTSATLKRRISGFTAGSTKNVDAEDKRLVNAVDVYVSDFGMHKLFIHRYVSVSGDVNNDIIGLKNSKFKVAHLSGRTPKHVPIAKVGDSTRGMIVGEFTLEYLNERAAFIGKSHL